MSEEENNAIEYLTKWVHWETAGERNLEGDIETALNLINKQQNKIASLEKQIKLMQSCDLEKVIKEQQNEIEKQQEEIEELKDDKIKMARAIKYLATNFKITEDEVIEFFCKKKKKK